MLAPNSSWPSQILTTLPFTLPVVRNSKSKVLLFELQRPFSDARHRFITEEPDWGFTRFSELPKLLHPRPGHNRPMIEEDSTVFSAYVRVLEDPTGVLWHNFIK